MTITSYNDHGISVLINDHVDHEEENTCPETVEYNNYSGSAGFVTLTGDDTESVTYSANDIDQLIYALGRAKLEHERRVALDGEPS